MRIVFASSVYMSPDDHPAVAYPVPHGLVCSVSARSRQIVAAGTEGSALCGVVNVNSGVIDLRPLTPDEDYRNAPYVNPPARRIAPPEHITHFDPTKGDATSHEQLVALVGGAIANYIGFTLRLGSPVTMICTSRGLNAPKFSPMDHANGRMSTAWATVIRNALEEVPVVFQALESGRT